MASATETQDFARGLVSFLETVASIQPDHPGDEANEDAQLTSETMPLLGNGIEVAGADEPDRSRLFLYVPLRTGTVIKVILEPLSPSTS